MIILIGKNNEYILDIIGVGYEGEGIAKIDGYPIFIEGAILGEKVRVLIVKAKKVLHMVNFWKL